MALMDIINGFRGITPAAPAQQPGVNPQQTNPTAQGNPSIPNGQTATPDGTGPGAFPAVGTGEKSPLENYKDLWNIDPKATGAIQAVSLVPNLQIDNAVINNAAKTLDFSKAIPADILAQAAKGDVTAFAAALNHVGQASYAQGAAASIAIAQKAFGDQAKTFEEKYLPQMQRQQEISSTLRQEVKLYENPAAAPILATLEKQFSQKYPTASPAEITAHAQSYLNEFAAEVVKANGGSIMDKASLARQQQQQPKQQDWETLLTQQQNFG